MIAARFICPTCQKPMALDAFSGEGGATRGLMDAGFCVTAIDNDPNRLKHNPAPHKVLVEDAVVWIAYLGHRFYFIWTSPPCQDYSRGTAAMRSQGRTTGYLRLIAATREALLATRRPYIIENVEDARGEMEDPVILCGRMFGLGANDADGTPLVLDRHRAFETSFHFMLKPPPHPTHDDAQVAGIYGGARRAKVPKGTPYHVSAPLDRYEAKHVRKGGYVPRSKAVKGALLGIDWMTCKGLDLSIPPVYARVIGEAVLDLAAA